MTYPLFHPACQRSVPLMLDAGAFAREFPGESRHVEFKQGVSEARIARAVAAFSNTDGGVVLVGVTPEGRPIGVNTDGEALARLHRIVGTVHDGGRYEIMDVTVDDRTIAVIAVQRRQQGFSQTSDGQVVVRRDAMNVTLMGAQLADFVTRHVLARFEATAVRCSLMDADQALVRSTSEVFGWSQERELADRLIEQGLAVREHAVIWLTIAGALYLLTDPGQELGKSYIEVFRYRDDASATEDKRYTVNGPLPVQVREATARVLDEIGSDVVVVGIRRYELDRIPTEVLREAIANAVAHRVYEDNRRSVRIEIRPTYVRVVSPGPLPEPVTVANMRDQNAARNLTVISVLRRFRLAEDAGRGVDLMQDAMAEQLLDAPRFSANEASVTVELPLTSTVSPVERAWVAEIESRGELRPRDRILVVHAARGMVMTNSSARELLGVDSTHARNALRRLCDAGLLVREGHRAGARYSLAPRITPPPGLRLSRVNIHELVLDLAETTNLTNGVLRERLSIDRVEALRVLNELVESGKLERVGTRRGSHYVLSQASREDDLT
jgi:ATP-dependent DNA helicase RecG